MSPPTALIAEDEPLLAQALAAELHRAWPALQLLPTVGDGASAVRAALARRPDVLFLDIRMPGMDGLAAAAALAEEWPGDAPFPALVFATAYDQYAVQAFEAQAVDYLLKPVQPARLQKTVERVQAALARRGPAAHPAADAAFRQLRSLLDALPATPAPAPAAAPLRLIPASEAGSNGAVVRMVPIGEVLAFEAADKYVRVLSAGREYLIRTPLKELLPQLDPQQFWQVHRGTVVRADAVETVERDEAGRLQLRLRGLREPFGVSRLYAHLFRAL
ncbi:LytR/AlgR family response regulator transcription factor [Xylophilus sp. ASV27]|uniref:LytR/AlgR family response regulator transcription factor n=1 Tax=Xylophilus sp. ASV27 TaxID=2795129 RepID=UPI0018ED21F7|nr:LytTR family DNA-binding domain-containing protein [Xylophilus sp. ASV27]